MGFASRDPRGFELENADAIYRYANVRFDYGIREERERRIPSAVDGLLWSLATMLFVKFENSPPSVPDACVPTTVHLGI